MWSALSRLFVSKSHSNETSTASGVPSVEEMESYKLVNAKQRSSVKWLLSKAFANKVPEDLREPFYRDHEGHEHLKPHVVHGLASAELYCQALANLYADPNYHQLNHWGVIQALARKGIYVGEPTDVQLTETVLIQTTPLRMSAHMVVIESIMNLFVKEIVTAERVVACVKRIGGDVTATVPADHEEALLLWINTTCRALQRKMDGEALPVYRHLSELSDGIGLSALVSFYCPEEFPWADVVQSSNKVNTVGNLKQVYRFCQSALDGSDLCHLTVEDLLYMHSSVRQNVLAFIADLFHVLETKRICLQDSDGGAPTDVCRQTSNGSGTASLPRRQNSVPQNRSRQAAGSEGAKVEGQEDFVVHRGKVVPTLLNMSHSPLPAEEEPLMAAQLRPAKEKFNTDTKAEERGEHDERRGEVPAAGKPSNWEERKPSSYSGRRSRRNSLSEESHITLENFGGSQENLHLLGRNPDKEPVVHVGRCIPSRDDSDERLSVASWGEKGDREKVPATEVPRSSSSDDLLSGSRKSPRKATSFAEVSKASPGGGINIIYMQHDQPSPTSTKHVPSRKPDGKKTSFVLPQPQTTTWQEQQRIPDRSAGSTDDDHGPECRETHAMASQLHNIRLKLEEKRRRIETDKQKMEVAMSRQRQKMGKAAFLQAVAKGKSPPSVGSSAPAADIGGGGDGASGDGDSSSIMGDSVEQMSAIAKPQRPYSLQEISEDLSTVQHKWFERDGVGAATATVAPFVEERKTPDIENMDFDQCQQSLAQMDNSLHELQSDIQRLSLQQQQIQQVMSTANAHTIHNNHHVSEPQVQQSQFFLHDTSRQSPRRMWGTLQNCGMAQEQVPPIPPVRRAQWGQPQPVQVVGHQMVNHQISAPYPESQPYHPLYQNGDNYYYSGYQKPSMGPQVIQQQVAPHLQQHMQQQMPHQHYQQQVPQQHIQQQMPQQHMQQQVPQQHIQQQIPQQHQQHMQHISQPMPSHLQQQPVPPPQHSQQQMSPQVYHVQQHGYNSMSSPTPAAPAPFRLHADSHTPPKPVNSVVSQRYEYSSRDGSPQRSVPVSTAVPHSSPQPAPSPSSASSTVRHAPLPVPSADDMEPQNVSFIESPDGSLRRNDRSGSSVPSRETRSSRISNISSGSRTYRVVGEAGHSPPRPGIGRVFGSSDSSQVSTPSASEADAASDVKTAVLRDGINSDKGFYITFDDSPKRQKPPLRPRKSTLSPKKSFPSLDEISSTMEPQPCHEEVDSSPRRHIEPFSVDDMAPLEDMAALVPDTEDDAHDKSGVGLVIGSELVKPDPNAVDEMEKKKERIMLLSLRRKQQQEEEKQRKESEAQRRREAEKMREELKARKKEDEKARRAAILEQYKMKKAMEEAEREGKVLEMPEPTSAKSVPKLRSKPFASRPRPKTIHVDNNSTPGSSMTPSRGKLLGSNNNLAEYKSGVLRRSDSRRGSNQSLVGGAGSLSRRGSNASLYSDMSVTSPDSGKGTWSKGSRIRSRSTASLDEDASLFRINSARTLQGGHTGKRVSDSRGANPQGRRGSYYDSWESLSGSGWQGSRGSLHEDAWENRGSRLRSPSVGSHVGRKGSVGGLVGNGPGSLPLGLISRRRGFDDGASDVSSATSSNIDYCGPRLFKQPAAKSNRSIILNAVEYCVFPGAVNREAKQRVLEEIARSESKHFLVLFRDAGCQFRALYSYVPERDEVFKLYGTGPKTVGDNMLDKFFKYNSGSKCFAQVHTKHLTVTIDAFTIHNSIWQGKRHVVHPNKKDMALVV